MPELYVRTTVAAEPINAAARVMNLDMQIACALNPTQFAERKRMVNRLAQEATERRTLPDGVRLCLRQFLVESLTLRSS